MTNQIYFIYFREMGEKEKMREENKRLRATIDAYAKQVNRLETRLLKYEKIHDGKFVDKSITTSESKSLFDN